MKMSFRVLSLAVMLALAGCVTVPSGPSLMSLPGSGKSFDQFRLDDGDCRQFASSQVGGNTPNQASADSGVASAAVGTVVGAAAGAAIGGNSAGAGVGAGVGLLTGALVGSSAAYASSYSLQQRYDIGYTQCMYAKGHKVPVSGRFASANDQPARRYSTPPPPPPPSYR
ncbi:MAG TPA: YMGG-like glycine zipper-containing protein [Burkholderiales bacterium]|nr:YMGG-like glycine zipper-containing protein [Burkholderiales bacterium]